MTDDLFDKLFVFDMANNHSGSLEHGLRIIHEISDVTKEFDEFKFGFKLQYRDLDTFIHPDFKERTDIKYVKRFSETRLEFEQLKELKDEIKKLGFVAICTPFDENSVDKIIEHDFDIIKIASCSFTDWPLLEKVSKTDKPIIASVAGVTIDNIDKVVSFFEHRKKKFGLMHCVAEYPTPNDKLQLNQMSLFRKRYSGTPIGYSTHESPDNFDAIKVAIGNGAKIFEKHVGIPTETIKLNDYSANPKQIKKWLCSAKEAFSMCGTGIDKRMEFTDNESLALRSLQRGIFAKRNIRIGERISKEDVFFAIPSTEDQLLANDFSKYNRIISNKNFSINNAITHKTVTQKDLKGEMMQIMETVTKLFEEANVQVPQKVDTEVSHHYGIEKFYEFGAVILNIINREYCKKLIVMLPGQKHPAHAHRLKEETFHILYGSVIVDLNGKETKLNAGNLLIVDRNIMHSFRTDTGVIFEEISTTHILGDSYYLDENITKNKSRKTELTYWSKQGLM
ncbi:MAG: N-acetylneuraminate synthase family protein [Candidatus Micrarchaeota archaeon]|nr:N-acetylneuraminate synthase family protein [Candidatus Micrarchaeota archaeon]